MVPTPFLYDSFIHYFTPVYPDAIQAEACPTHAAQPPGNGQTLMAGWSLPRLRQLEQQLPRAHRLAGLHLNRLQHAIDGGADLDLHLHGLDHQHRLVLADGLAGDRQHGVDAPGNRRTAERVLEQFQRRAGPGHRLGDVDLGGLPTAMTVVPVFKELDRHIVAFLFDLNPQFHLLSNSRLNAVPSSGSKMCGSRMSTRPRAGPPTPPARPRPRDPRPPPLPPLLRRQPQSRGGPPESFSRRS